MTTIERREYLSMKRVQPKVFLVARTVVQVGLQSEFEDGV